MLVFDFTALNRYSNVYISGAVTGTVATVYIIKSEGEYPTPLMALYSALQISCPLIGTATVTSIRFEARQCLHDYTPEIICVYCTVLTFAVQYYMNRCATRTCT